MFPLATIWRGVHSLVITCVLGSKCETWMFYYRRESVGQDYERDRLIGLDHK